jgi:hypothetical protein
MDPAVFANDIPLEIARAAHSGTSFSPERRAEQERESYAGQLARDWNELATLADTPEKLAQLEEEFERYRAGFRERSLAHLQAKSRCMSTMITGGSNFPVRRQQKLGHRADRRGAELLEFRNRALGRWRALGCAGDGYAGPRDLARAGGLLAMAKQTAANNPLLREIKRRMNVPTFRKASELMNSSGPEAVVVFMLGYFAEHAKLAQELELRTLGRCWTPEAIERRRRATGDVLVTAEASQGSRWCSSYETGDGIQGAKLHLFRVATESGGKVAAGDVLERDARDGQLFPSTEDAQAHALNAGRLAWYKVQSISVAGLGEG